jgi:hypothetical protein
MRYPNVRTTPSQLLRGFLLQDGLPLNSLLSVSSILKIITDELGTWINGIYTPIVTLGAFLIQLLEKDHSCSAAVERVNADRLDAGLPPCSPDTGAYCKARERMPLSLFKRLLTGTAQHIQEKMPHDWSFKGRPVKIVDGTGASMPDTPRNRREFLLPGGQVEGIGFPMARVLVVVGMVTGAVLSAAVNACRGKKTGECAALRLLHDQFQRCDILLGDNLYSSYIDIALLTTMGVDAIFAMHAQRNVDFRTGTRLGPDDHLVIWHKPRRCPDWMSKADYDNIPSIMVMRELRIRVVRRGFRTRIKLIVTTLLAPREFSKEELGDLAGQRWQVELDIRSLKQSLAMDVLRCKSPEMVRKEIWGHLLVYNLIRIAMAAAAHLYGLTPRQLSFDGARKTLLANGKKLSEEGHEAIGALTTQLLWRLAQHRVGDRPGRHEPRERKRRPKPSKYMTLPRCEARRRSALAP